MLSSALIRVDRSAKARHKPGDRGKLSNYHEII